MNSVYCSASGELFLSSRYVAGAVVAEVVQPLLLRTFWPRLPLQVPYSAAQESFYIVQRHACVHALQVIRRSLVFSKIVQSAVCLFRVVPEVAGSFSLDQCSLLL